MRHLSQNRKRHAEVLHHPDRAPERDEVDEIALTLGQLSERALPEELNIL